MGKSQAKGPGRTFNPPLEKCVAGAYVEIYQRSTTGPSCHRTCILSVNVIDLVISE